ncbi:nuclear respiratory factor 1-like [Styela clava]|uniref:nuclear respiratory factor 1-like n=1 Tax=Styela clava TaxID=7725 RepID=UPI00193AD38C|nr:nuclear respiratory factor 1-like [Styela clava]XP_039264450.1 nuclear respiratory factor 1-like [Styela clava]
MNNELGGHHISVSIAAGMAHPQDTEMLEPDGELGGPLSEDDDSLGDEDGFGGAHLLHSAIEDEITNSLTAAGTIPGLAAAAAVVTARRRQRPYKFETNPSTRKRQYTRLTRKLKHTMHEFCTRCGQQAVLLCVSPGKDNPSFKVFGASPLDQVLRSCQNLILRDLERVLQEQAPAAAGRNSENQFELPALIIDGIPTPVEKMNQAQLRMFVPEMLKYSTGRGKPGWGRESTRPVWWPLDVPWANVRRDVRTDDQKLKVSWTTALRQIVKNCYKYHGRDDLLQCFPSENSQGDRMNLVEKFCGVASARQQQQQHNTAQMNMTPPTLVQTVQNSDGSVSLVQLDSGQTIATITQDQTGQAVATLTAQDGSEGPLAVTMHQVSNGQWSIGTPENQQGISGIGTVAESPGNINQLTIDQEQHQVIINQTNTTINAISKESIVEHQHHHHHQPQQTSHTIGITFDSNGQAVATLQNTGIPSDSQIVLSTTADAVDEHGSTAMVQIPVSVYEKIANSIQGANLGGTVRRITTHRLDHNNEIEIDTGQDSPTDVNLGSLRVDG